MRKLLVFLFVLSLVAGNAQLAEVRAVHDGDSYRVLFLDGTSKWIRVWGVDAPEVPSNKMKKYQDFGKEAGDSMRQMLRSKFVYVDSISVDYYGRTVAKISFDSLDITTYLISTGKAWWYDNSNLSGEDLQILKALQQTAKDNKVGLWGLPGKKIRPATFRSRYTVK